MGGVRNLKLGGATWGKGQGTGGKGNRCEWIKCLPEGTLPKPTFRLGATGEGAKARAQGAVAPAPLVPPMPIFMFGRVRHLEASFDCLVTNGKMPTNLNEIKFAHLKYYANLPCKNVHSTFRCFVNFYVSR